MNADPTTRYEAVTFDAVKVGDELSFVRIYRGFEFPGGEARTIRETVTKVTAQTVQMGDCRLTRKKWHEAEVRRAVSP